MLDDMEKRLNQLFDALNNEEISSDVIQQLTDLVRGIYFILRIKKLNVPNILNKYPKYFISLGGT